MLSLLYLFFSFWLEIFNLLPFKGYSPSTLLSNNESICNKVDFPDPEGPVNAN